MFSYLVTLVFVQVDYYASEWTEHNPEKLVFSDENAWLARNKMLLYLANEEWRTEFLYYYNVQVKLQCPNNQELIDLGKWVLRFVGREKWLLNWEKEKEIFRSLGYITPQNEVFYQLTQELYTPPPTKELHLDLANRFLEFGTQMPDFQRLCSMHIGLIYLRIREEKMAFDYFSQGNETEIKSLFYRAALSIKYLKSDSLETFRQAYPEEKVHNEQANRNDITN